MTPTHTHTHTHTQINDITTKHLDLIKINHPNFIHPSKGTGIK